jgi:uncharacterized protein DUF397
MQDDVRDIGTSANWIRSSTCGPAGGNCVELNLDRAAVLVRDSKRGNVDFLTFTGASWTTFVRHCARS